jgi:PAN domain-containing protein
MGRHDAACVVKAAGTRPSWSHPMRAAIAFVLSMLVLATGTPALAQGPQDIVNRVKSFIHSAMARSAHSRWNKVPEAEYTCISQRLEERGEKLDALIDRGFFPGDRRIARVRSQCRGAVATPQFQRLADRAFRRSGQDALSMASSYQECEQACSRSSSCAALTYFRAERICRMMQSTTELTADDGADSAIRSDPPTGSVDPQTPTAEAAPQARQADP